MTPHRQAFTHQSFATRVLFGEGCLARLEDELVALRVERVLVLCTPQQRETAERIAAPLGRRAVAVFHGAQMHVPIETARQAAAFARHHRADGLLAVGGGSTIGLAKAVALAQELPILAVPSTFAGSEMTPIYGITDGGVKKTGRDARMLPRAVLYDPAMVRTLPAALCVTSAFNAMAHAIEALYAHDGSPVVSLMAEEGLRAMASAVELLHRDPDSALAREQGLYGAWLCGSTLGAVSMGLHHKLCHTLGGSFNLPHAESHTALLPHSVAYNAAHAPQAMAQAGRALGVPASEVSATLHRLVQASGAAVALRELGMPQDGIERAADLAVKQPYPNPRPLERDALRDLLRRAYEGSPPILEELST